MTRLSSAGQPLSHVPPSSPVYPPRSFYPPPSRSIYPPRTTMNSQVQPGSEHLFLRRSYSAQQMLPPHHLATSHPSSPHVGCVTQQHAASVPPSPHHVHGTPLHSPAPATNYQHNTAPPSGGIFQFSDAHIGLAARGGEADVSALTHSTYASPPAHPSPPGLQRHAPAQAHPDFSHLPSNDDDSAFDLSLTSSSHAHAPSLLDDVAEFDFEHSSQFSRGELQLFLFHTCTVCYPV